MSFITQDKDLIKALLKIANNKYAQAQTPPPDPAKNTQILSQLVNNLRQNLDNYTEGDFTSEREDAALNLKNLQSDYQFLLFLQQNSILWNNKPLSIVHSPGLSANEQSKQHFEIFKANGSINPKEYVKYPEPRGGSGDDFRFWINKEGVTEFLRSLYDKSKNERSGGKLLKVLLDKLLISINKNSGQPIDPNSKPAPKLPPDFSIDQFPQPYLLSKPFENRGPQVLTIKDISSPSEFNGWLSNLKVNDKNNQEISAPANKNSICFSLNAILDRAEHYKNQTSRDLDAQKKETYEYYYNQILSFMNANNCNVNTNVPTTTEKTEKGGPDDKESGDRRRTETIIQKDNLDRLMKNLPLNTSNINFPDIKEFFRYVIGYSENTEDKKRYENYENIVNSYIGQYQRLLHVNTDQIFDLRSNPRDLQAKLQNPSNYLGALEYLQHIVSNTREAISYLKTRLERNGSLQDQYISPLASQVGHSGSASSSIASQNIEILSRLESRVNEAVKISPGRR